MMLKFEMWKKKSKENQPAETELAAEAVSVESSESKSQKPESQTVEYSLQLDKFFLPEIKDEMLALWRYWAGDKLPPLLSLATGLELEKMQMTDSELEREKIRFMVRLNQEAKSRMKIIQNLQGNGAEVKLAAKCCCHVASNKMVAWLMIFPPVGSGENLTSEELGKTMEQSNVKNGIIAKKFVQILKETPYFELIPIAFGTPPVQGHDGVIHERVPKKVELQIAVDENGRADYRSTSYVRNVEKEQILCDIEPQSPGEDGLGVDGKVVPAKAVKPARVPQGRNTQVTEDGLHLIAAQAGHLEYINGEFQVRPVLDIPTDVDYSTGNIDFIGDVHIHGDVRENFVVKAKGTVIVDGLVEAATIIAGGDLLITSGVVGDTRAVLQSAGNVRAKYLESCQVYAGRSVYADCIIASAVSCDDSIIVITGKGSVIGGNLTAATAVQAKMIGARSGRQTEITLGEIPYATRELEFLQPEFEKTKWEQDQLQKKIVDMERCSATQENLAKTKIKKLALDVKLESIEKRMDDIKKKKPDLTQCMIVCDVIYPVTKVTIGNYTGLIENVQNKYKMKYSDAIVKLQKTK